MIPLYKLVDDLGWLGSYQGMILFYTGIQMPFTVFLYTGFIRALPPDYAQAALIDGATTGRPSPGSSSRCCGRSPAP